MLKIEETSVEPFKKSPVFAVARSGLTSKMASEVASGARSAMLACGLENMHEEKKRPPHKCIREVGKKGQQSVKRRNLRVGP